MAGFSDLLDVSSVIKDLAPVQPNGGVLTIRNATAQSTIDPATGRSIPGGTTDQQVFALFLPTDYRIFYDSPLTQEQMGQFEGVSSWLLFVPDPLKDTSGQPVTIQTVAPGYDGTLVIFEDAPYRVVRQIIQNEQIGGYRFYTCRRDAPN